MAEFLLRSARITSRVETRFFRRVEAPQLLTQRCRYAFADDECGEIPQMARNLCLATSIDDRSCQFRH